MASASERPFRVGIIGTGFGSRVHVPAYQQAPGFEIVAVVSRRLERAEAAARKAGAAWFSDDYRRMLGEVDLDLVSIATNGPLHHEMVLAAAAAGRHILCEKPLATSVQQVREMLDAVRQAGVRHVVNHEFRMRPARLRFHEVAASGELGTLFDARAISSAPMLLAPNRGWSWWSDRAQYGGIMQAITSHVIDMLLWCFGDVQSVAAQVDTFIRERRDEAGVMRPVTSDDQDAALLRFASGASGTVHVSGVSRVPRTIFEAHGSDASVMVEGEEAFLARGTGPVEQLEVAALRADQDPLITTMAAYLGHVARVLRGESDELVATFEQGLRIQAVMDALHASSDQGGERVPVATA